MLAQIDRDRNSDDLRSRDGIAVIPYVRLSDGEWTIPDDAILAFYHQLQAEHTAQNISGNVIHTPAQFLSFMQSGQVFPVIMAHDGEIGGGAWLSHVGKASAWVHVAFLRWAHGPLAERMAAAAFEYWDAMQQNGEPVLKVLLGSTPASFRPAVSFARRLGFTILGEVPYVENGSATVFSYRVNARLR